MRISASAWRMTLAEQLLLLRRVAGFRRRMGGRAQPADRRAKVVREAVGQQPKLLHQPADPVEHRVDLQAEPVERVAAPGQRHALRQVARADAVGDRGDLADPPADIMGEDQAAQQAEQAGDDQRDQQRALERLADREALAGNAAADEPLPVGSRWTIRPLLAASSGRAAGSARCDSLRAAAARTAARLRDCPRPARPSAPSSATAVCGSA